MTGVRPLYVAEPGVVWQARPPLVVDCSLIASALFEEEDAEQATAALRGHALHAPALLPFEFANVARSKARAGAPADRLEAAMRGFGELRIELQPVDASEMLALALALGLTAYDAAYIAVAQAMQAPLLTFDQKLASAAARALGGPA